MMDWDVVREVLDSDLRVLKEKDTEYKGAWKARGGRGVWHQALTRKIDRIDRFVEDEHGGDIFAAIEADRRPEGVLDDIRDLRRYLALVDAEMITRHPELAQGATFARSAGPPLGAASVLETIENMIDRLPARGHIVSPLRDALRVDLHRLAATLRDGIQGASEAAPELLGDAPDTGGEGA